MALVMVSALITLANGPSLRQYSFVDTGSPADTTPFIRPAKPLLEHSLRPRRLRRRFSGLDSFGRSKERKTDKAEKLKGWVQEYLAHT